MVEGLCHGPIDEIDVFEVQYRYGDLWTTKRRLDPPSATKMSINPEIPYMASGFFCFQSPVNQTTFWRFSEVVAESLHIQEPTLQRKSWIGF